jgi:hypothetical protein
MAIRATSTIIAVLDPVKAKLPPAACELAGTPADKLLAPGTKLPDAVG